MKENDIETIEKAKEIIKAQIIIVQTIIPEEQFDEFTGAGLQVIRILNRMINSEVK